MSIVTNRAARVIVMAAIGASVVAGCGKSHSNGTSTVNPGSGNASSTTSPPSTPASSPASTSGGGYGY